VAELVVFAPPLPSVHIIAQANPCGYITQKSCLVGKRLNLLNTKFRPYHPTQLLLEQPQTNTNASTSRMAFNSPLLLKFKVMTILIAIMLDPGLLIPAGQLLQWVPSN
jgi:hypothetical protein